LGGPNLAVAIWDVIDGKRRAIGSSRAAHAD
jgi:hypothetical protein